MRRKQKAAIFILLILSGVFCGCKGQPEQDTSKELTQIDDEEIKENVWATESDKDKNINILLEMKDGMQDSSLQEYFKQEIEEAEELTNTSIIIKYYDFDLNDDGLEDKLVWIRSALHSGSHGDTFLILRNDEKTYVPISDVWVLQLFDQSNNVFLKSAVYIRNDKTNGFYDIEISTENNNIILKYQDAGYVNTNNVDYRIGEKDYTENKSDEAGYQLKTEVYSEDKINIQYPQMEGLGDDEKENKINKLIEDNILEEISKIKEQSSDTDELVFEMNYEVTMQTPEILSVLYRGQSQLYSQGEVYYYGCDINAQTINLIDAEEMNLSHFALIDTELVRNIKQSTRITGGAPDDWEKSREDLARIIQEQNEKYIIEGLQEEWDYYTFCVTPETIIVSIAIPHSEGDYALIEIERNCGKVYAMESLSQLIEEKLEFTNARQYEMNIILERIGIKMWYTSPYSMDEMESDFSVDAPLGEYSEEVLREYTEENFRAEFDYCCGYTSASYRNECEPDLIQITRIYKDDELYCLEYRFWENYISSVSGVVPIAYMGSYYIDSEDIIARVKENEHYYEYKNEVLTIEKTEKNEIEIEETKVKEKITNVEKGYTYRGENVVLTDGNIEETIEILLNMEGDYQLHKLENLPLTETFFNECIKDYPYIDDIEEVNEFNVVFWGMKEDGNYVCLCEFDKSDKWDVDSESDFYYVEIKLINNQIDDMIITLIEKSGKANERDR